LRSFAVRRTDVENRFVPFVTSWFNPVPDSPHTAKLLAAVTKRTMRCPACRAARPTYDSGDCIPLSN